MKPTLTYDEHRTIVLGIDPSMRSTGICFLGPNLEYVVFKTISTRKGDEHLSSIRSQLSDCYCEQRHECRFRFDIVTAVELNATKAAFGGRGFSLGEVSGVIKITLHSIDGSMPIEVSISSARKYFMGMLPVQDAKRKVLIAVNRLLATAGRMPVDSDEADAFIVANYTRKQLGLNSHKALKEDYCEPTNKRKRTTVSK